MVEKKSVKRCKKIDSLGAPRPRTPARKKEGKRQRIVDLAPNLSIGLLEARCEKKRERGERTTQQRRRKDGEKRREIETAGP